MTDFNVSDFINEKLGTLVEEAHELRLSVTAGSELTDGLQDLHERLLRARGAMDRLEEIIARLMTLRYQTKTILEERSYAADDKWDAQAVVPVQGFAFGDAAPRERYAKYNTATLNEQVSKRRALKDDAQVKHALELCRWFHEGLSGIRWTLDQRIRLIATYTRLEQ